MWKMKDRGVSPVIAVILMVAITVILSAAVGSFVLGIGSQVSEPPPTAAFEFEQENNTYDIYKGRGGGSYTDEFYTVNVIYEAGPAIDMSNIQITIESGPEPWQSGQAFWIDKGSGSDRALDLPFRGDGGDPDTIEAGDESGPLVFPYDPDNIEWSGHSKGRKSIENVDTKDSLESYNYNRGTGDLVLDYGTTHLALTRPSDGTTVRVVWTGGSKKDILAEYTIKKT